MISFSNESKKKCIPKNQTLVKAEQATNSAITYSAFGLTFILLVSAKTEAKTSRQSSHAQGFIMPIIQA
ncbi:MAG: hypothetical protein EAY75_18305 [Bacteroidetes bacterium]|nr:MAG: hypothetical protein EAY75_18305 [Bacteroidota bacterium]